jgi:hypothetical protein
MSTPIVTEIKSTLEPVTIDTFATVGERVMTGSEPLPRPRRRIFD